MWNREPLAPNRFDLLPTSCIRPHGWLHEQLRLSAEGLTGRLMELWPDVGSQSGWLGGPGENWERGPYYVRGLVALAHALQSEHLLAQAAPWIEWALASQTANGFFGPPDNDDWWPRMPMLEALRWHHDATGDARILPFMARYFHHQLLTLPDRPLDAWGRPRGGDNLDHVLWLYSHTADPALLSLADLLCAQTSDWLAEFASPQPASESAEFGHAVNRAMGFKTPAVLFQRSHDPGHLAALRAGWERTFALHGQVQGTFSGDEFLHGRGATQGTECCTIVELLSSFETALRISGDLWLGDAIELIVVNALPAILSADHCGRQYFEIANQIECTPGGRNFNVHHENDLLFGPNTGYGCCTANLHMGWPRFAAHLWLRERDGGLMAPLFAPCTVRAEVATGETVSIVEDTAYPFDDEVRFIVTVGHPVRFSISLRLPAWTDAPWLTVNGHAPDPREIRTASSLVRITRTWRTGDTLRLHLPMRLRTSRWDAGAVAIERGPLVFALGIGEDWRKVAGVEPFADYEVHPTTPWNYGLVLDPDTPHASMVVERGRLGAQPWARDGAGIRLRASGKRIPDWIASGGVSGPIPSPPVRVATATEPIALIPFGCARLRIALFPVVT